MATVSIMHPLSSVGTLNFLAATSQTGWPIDVATVVEEELTSPGIDGKRWRTQMHQHTEIQMNTLADATSWDLAKQQAQLYLQAVTGDPVTLTSTIAGTTYRWRNVHILGVQPLVAPGGCFGAGAASGSAAHIIGTWRLILVNPFGTGETG